MIYTTNIVGPPTTTAPKLRSRLRRVGHQIYTLIYYALLCYGLHLQYHYYDQFSDWMDAFLYAIRYMTYAVNVAIVVFGIHYRRAEYGILFQQFSCVDVHFMRLLVDEDAGNDNDTAIDDDDDDDDDSNRSDAAPTIPDCMLNTRLEFVNLQSRLRCGLAAFVTLVLSLSVINFYTQSAGWATSLLLIVCPNCTLGMCQIQLVFAMFWLRARFRLCAVLVQRRLGAGDGLLVETPGPRRLERTLLRLGRLHAQLTQINGALTRNFGLLLVGNVVSVSVVMTIVFYAIFRIASGSPAAGRARLDVPSVLYMLVWFLIYAVRVLPVLWHSARMRRDRRAVLEPLHLLECDAHRATSEAERRAVCICVCVCKNEMCVYLMWSPLCVPDQTVLAADPERCAESDGMRHSAIGSDAVEFGNGFCVVIY